MMTAEALLQLGQRQRALKHLGKSLVLMLAVQGPVCNTQLIAMSISSSTVQRVVFFHFSSLFAFPFITFINTSLSFPLRNL